MKTTIVILTTIVAIEHIVFLYIEMFLWTKKLGRKIFANSVENAEKTRVLASNQGLYNGFLSAGLIWGLIYPDPVVSNEIILFFLICVLLAGIYGGMTAKISIIYIQALPAFITIIFILVKISSI